MKFGAGVIPKLDTSLNLIYIWGKKKGCVQYNLGGVVLSLRQKLEGNLRALTTISILQCYRPFFTRKKYLVLVLCKPVEKNLPKQLISTEKDLMRGDALSLESNHVFLTKWLDNKPVDMISNFLAVNPKHQKNAELLVLVKSN